MSPLVIDRQNGGVRWSELFIDENGALVFNTKRSFSRYVWLTLHNKVAYPVYLLEEALELVTHLPELNGEAETYIGKDTDKALTWRVDDLCGGNLIPGMTQNLGVELFSNVSVEDFNENLDLASQNSPMRFQEIP